MRTIQKLTLCAVSGLMATAFSVNSAHAYKLRGSGTNTIITCNDGSSFIKAGLMSQESATKICADHGGIREMKATNDRVTIQEKK